QSSLRYTRHALAMVGLTAARFDLLYAVQKESLPTRQSDLRRTLGVSRSTVSVMLASLEELGLVTRVRPAYGDRRTRIVRLTPEGLARTRVALRRLIRWGSAKLAVESALARHLWHSEGTCFWETAACAWFLRRLRHYFGDFATLDYPW